MRVRESDLFEDAGLNLAPMIDVVFLLLIFFMVATNFSQEQEQLDVNLPDSNAGEAAESAQEITIVLHADGRIFVNDEAMPEDRLPLRMRELAGEDSALPVTICGDREVALQRVDAVMDAFVRAGLRAVGMMTQDG